MNRTDLGVIQDMIAISADRLEGLRTQCATSSSLTQLEIRCLETKLVRMFSELLLTKERLNERLPASGLSHTTRNELEQWLRVVGLSADSLKPCLALSTLEQLLEQSDDELRRLVSNNPSYREEEVRRLTKAMQNLRRCKEFLANSNNSSSNSSSPTEHLLENLYWDSWDRHHFHRGSVGNIGNVMSSPRTHRVLLKQARQQQQQQQNCGSNSNRQSPLNSSSSFKSTAQQEDSLSFHGSTLTPSPPSSPFSIQSAFGNYTVSGMGGGGSLNSTPLRGMKNVGTPPAIRKHHTLIGNTGGGGNQQQFTPTHCMSDKTAGGGGLLLSNSKSNDSQLHDTSVYSSASSPPSLKTAATMVIGNNNANSSCLRSRLQTDPSPDSFSSTSSDIFVEAPGYNNTNSLQVPRSPCTPIVIGVGMGHTISHRFTKVFKIMAICDLCQKQMFFGLKCKECKYKCHKDCEQNVPPSCGLPREYVDEFKKKLQDQIGFQSINANNATNQSSVNNSPNLNTMGKHNRPNKHLNNAPNATCLSSSNAADSSSAGSSCNSSSPSSPALFILHHHHQQQQQQNSSFNSNSIVGGTSGTGGGYSGNLMSSSVGGSSSTSSNLLSTPSSFHKNMSQFNFPDVTVTANCNQSSMDNNATHTLHSSQASNSGDIGCTSSQEDYFTSTSGTSTMTTLSSSVSTTTSETVTAANSFAQTVPTVSSPAISISNTSTSGATNSMSSIIQHLPINVGTSSSITMSIASTTTGSFYPRKLSSAGVDKRGPFSELSDTHKSNDSDKTVSLSGSTSASTDSDRTPVRLDSTEDGDSGHWPRQNSLSAKEWDIPYGDLCLLEQIGKGRFGTVHRALWHGDVAVKLLKEDYLHDERMLEAFRLEVANFKKTRHENLVLFMGACMNPPYLAIVTSLCKGNTLYTYIHTRRDKFTINKTTLVAQQISQGMGYLHARGILHKDLRTKNIFLENGKVIITDFGLFSSTKLVYCDIGLGVPSGWLCYMSPELIRALLPKKPGEEVLPFTRASDVYSFGTVWYELLCGEFPFKVHPPESIIWQVGRGMKQTLANLHTSREVKDILMLCWSFQADDRPDFSKLLTLLEKLPKKRLARSPSHPVQLSRSAESVF